MQPSPVPLCLTLIIALGPVVLSDQETNSQLSAPGPEDLGQCATCEVRQQTKTMRLNAIKSQILSKLRMKEAPNISREVVKQLLPKAPPLQQLLDQYDVVGDDNRDAVMEEDDEHAVTERIMLTGTERKFLSFRDGFQEESEAAAGSAVVRLTQRRLSVGKGRGGRTGHPRCPHSYRFEGRRARIYRQKKFVGITSQVYHRIKLLNSRSTSGQMLKPFFSL